MATRILADRSRQEFHWLTTADVARRLGLTKNGVRWLVRTGQLACEWTRSGQRLWRYGEVQRCLTERADARARSRRERLAAVRVRMLKARLEPRQVRLRLVG
jgi:Helix-turn-helix domain